MDLGLQGKVALVTGGSKGIGKGICTELAREGVHVAVCARGQGPLDAAKAEIERLGVKSIALSADVTDKGSAPRVFDKVMDTFGRLDILVNNAGGDAATTHTVEDDDEIWEHCYAMNFWPTIRFTRLAVKQMKLQGGGNIINISSVGGHTAGWPGVSDYSSAKASILMLTKTWSLDLAPFNIRVNCVNPGFIRTPLWENLAKGFIPKLGNDIEEVFKTFTAEVTNLKRMGRPEDVGSTVAFLSSDARAGFVTGECWNVDGGYSRSL